MCSVPFPLLYHREGNWDEKYVGREMDRIVGAHSSYICIRLLLFYLFTTLASGSGLTVPIRFSTFPFYLQSVLVQCMSNFYLY